MTDLSAAPTTAAPTTAAPATDTVAERLVGTWTTVLDNDGVPVPGLSAFTADGRVILTQLNTKNIGLGNWVATGPDSFRYNAHILASDETGSFKGTAHIVVAGSFDTAVAWAGSGGATFHDAEGNPLRSHDGSRVVATKFGVDS